MDEKHTILISVKPKSSKTTFLSQFFTIFIIGKPKSSKTIFLAQFVTIARKDKSTVRFWKTPENIQPIQDAIVRLRKGEEAQSTPADNTVIITLPIAMQGFKFELKCPD